MKKYTWYWHCETDAYVVKEVKQGDDLSRGVFDSFEEARQNALNVLFPALIKTLDECAADIEVAFEAHMKDVKDIKK